MGEKTNKLKVHPYKPVSWLPPDEWATTKEACRVVVRGHFFQ